MFALKETNKLVSTLQGTQSWHGAPVTQHKERKLKRYLICHILYQNALNKYVDPLVHFKII